MADIQGLHDKLDRLIELISKQNELAERRLQQEPVGSPRRTSEVSSHATEPPRAPAPTTEESFLGDPDTPTPINRVQPPRSVSFGGQAYPYTDEEVYATPTGSRYQRKGAPAEPHWSEVLNTPAVAKPDLKLPFPKFDPRDLEMFLIEAEAWFTHNGVTDHSSMVNYTGNQLDGSAREWWKSKLRADRAKQGRLFHDWDFFTLRLREQYSQRNPRLDAYNQLQSIRMTSDAPGAATRHVERFRDLEGRANLEDNELVIFLFRNSLTRSLQEKFERNPPTDRWGWYREVEAIDRNRVINQQAAQSLTDPRVRATPRVGGPIGPGPQAAPLKPPAAPPKGNPQPGRMGDRPLPPHLAQRLPPRGSPTTFGSNTCHICQGTGHWANNCPSKRPAVTPRPSGPRVYPVAEDTADDQEQSVYDNGQMHQEEAELDLGEYIAEEDHQSRSHDAEEQGNETGAKSATVLELVGTINGHEARILADTGAGLSILSRSFVSRFNITTKATKTRTVHGVTGHTLHIDSDATIKVDVGGRTLGTLQVPVAATADYDLIIGFDELKKLKPTIDWDTGQVSFQPNVEDVNSRLQSCVYSISPSVGISSRYTTASLNPMSAESSLRGPYSQFRHNLVPHGHEFVSARELVQAALEDGPIGFMLLDTPPSSLPSFGFVPTGEDRGVEMEVEPEETAKEQEIPEPYRDLSEVFCEVEADKLPLHTDHDLHIELLPGGKPPQGPLYLKGPKEMAELRKYLDENLTKGFIRPSKSPARSPVLFVPKKDGGLRLCVDYRGLNEVTLKNRAPLPLIEEQLFLLRNATIYTKLDLKAAYNLVRIAEGDEWKTAFGTQLGLYEYLVMPFGLANAPAQFQSLVNMIYRDIIGVYVVVYLDDFLIFSQSKGEHIGHVREVLQRLKAHRLFAKLSKCSFHTDSVEFLGYIIKPTGIEMDQEKVKTIKEWPMPESIHDIQRFLGFANFYRRFVSHFARIARPLTSLVKPTERFKRFELPDDAKEGFHKLIDAFTTAGVLRHFDYNLPTRMETDASDFAIAGVLKQEHEGRWHPIAFYSRKMSSAERNYEIHDKELLAVVACLTQWRHMLAGLPNQLVILTDHEALKYFKSQRRITGRQARWAVLLADFDFLLQYRPGDKAGEPDALTRRKDMQPEGEEREHNVRQLLPASAFVDARETDIKNSVGVNSISAKSRLRLAHHNASLNSESPRSSLRVSNTQSQPAAAVPTMADIVEGGLVELTRTFQPLDLELVELHKSSPFDIKDGVWYKDGRLAVPKVTLPGKQGEQSSPTAKQVKEQSLSVEHLRYMVMSQCHDGVSAGHVGRDATLELARRHYWWPGMSSWIADYVASCPVCARYKAPRHRPYGLLQPLSTPERPWGSISMDFIEGLPESEGFDSIFVVVDRLTKFAILAPTLKTATSQDTADLLRRTVMPRFGIPDHIVSDRGRQFISATWRAFAEQWCIRHSLSTAYHPQTDGQTERVNQVVEQYLRMYCNYDQNNWVSLLPTAEFVYNNTVHSSIGVSPFFACYGWNPRAHPELPHKVGVHDPQRHEFAIKHSELTKHLQEQIRLAQSRAVEQHNRKRREIEFKVGDMVLVNRKNWKTRRATQKLDTRFAGPYPVAERIGRRAYRLLLPTTLRVHDVFHVSMLERVKASQLPGRNTLPAHPELPHEDLEYEVEAILDRRGTGKRLEYRVLWRGYPEEAASWEPLEALQCPDLIQEYEASAGGRNVRRQ